MLLNFWQRDISFNAPKHREQTKDRSMAVMGRCLCGSIEVKLNDAPSEIIACYCTSCQKATGGPASFNIIKADNECAITKGTTKFFIELADSGSKLERHFCDGCGCPIYSKTETYPGVKIFKAALFSDAQNMKVVTNIWTRSAPEWAVLHDGVPSHAKGRT